MTPKLFSANLDLWTYATMVDQFIIKEAHRRSFKEIYYFSLCETKMSRNFKQKSKSLYLVLLGIYLCQHLHVTGACYDFLLEFCLKTAICLKDVGSLLQK